MDRDQELSQGVKNWTQIVVQMMTIILLAFMTIYFYKMQAAISDLILLIREQEGNSDNSTNSTIRKFNGTISIQNSPVLHDLNTSKVVVVEFSDFECPFCATASIKVTQLQKENPDVFFVHKDYPLKYHTQAENLAVAARCAGEQGKYWSFYQSIYESSTISEATYKVLAEKNEIDIPSFMECMGSHEQLNYVKQDFEEGLAIKVDRVPLFIVGTYTDGDNTIHINGAYYSVEELATAIDSYKNK